jgi:hypothetical protein
MSWECCWAITQLAARSYKQENDILRTINSRKSNSIFLTPPFNCVQNALLNERERKNSSEETTRKETSASSG